MAPVEAMAERVRKNRKRAAPENSCVAMQEVVSRQIAAALDAWRQTSEWLAEQTFLAIYGQPALQAATGIDAAGTGSQRKVVKDLLHGELVKTKISDLKSRIRDGGLREAVIRVVLYVGMARGSVDERGFEAVRAIRRVHSDLPLPDFKQLVREQFYMLLIDTEAALAAVPAMLPADAGAKLGAFELIKQITLARGELSAEDRIRMLRVAALFGVDRESSAIGVFAIAPVPPRMDQEKAS